MLISRGLVVGLAMKVIGHPNQLVFYFYFYFLSIGISVMACIDNGLSWGGVLSGLV